MENEFVTFEQALALKELGFGDHYGDDYFAWYSNNKDFHYRNMNSPVYPNNQSFIAPLKQQVLRWFREKYNIHGEMFVNDNGTFIYLISRLVPQGRVQSPIKGMFNTYEEAENACIDKLIEIAKQQAIS